MIQEKSELEDFYTTDDPWGYEANAEDKNRKNVLLSELDKLPRPKRVLDIGCGHGFITREIQADQILGTDLSEKAIIHAKKTAPKDSYTYLAADMFNLTKELLNTPEGFDLILITGVIYPQYIGKSKTILYDVIDKLLTENGMLISVHISGWYTSRFPYVLLKNLTYKYREYQHLLEVYQKQ